MGRVMGRGGMGVGGGRRISEVGMGRVGLGTLGGG